MGSAQLELLGRDHLAITGPTSLRNGVAATTVTVTATDADDSATTDVDYDAASVEILSVRDSEDNELDYSYSLPTLTNGVGTITDLIVTIPGGTVGPITVSMRTVETEDTIKTATGHNYKPAGSVELPISVPTLVFSAQPSDALRDTNMTYTIQAQDGYGSVMAEITDTLTVTLTDAHASDEFKNCPDVGDPDSDTYNVALVAGEHAQTTQQITGGAGNKNDVTIVASHADYVNATSTSFTLATPLVIVDSVTHGVNIDSPRGLAIDSTDTYLYAALYGDGVVKIQLSDMTVSDQLLDGVNLDRAQDVSVNSAGTFVYSISRPDPGRITKIQTSDMTSSATLNVNAKNGVLLDADGTYAYVVGTDVDKILLSDMSLADTINDAQINNAMRIAIDSSNTYGYVTSFADNRLVKLQLSDMTISASVQDATNLGGCYGVVLDSTDTYAYVTNGGNNGVTKIQLSDMTVDSTLAGTTLITPRELAINSADEYLYVVSDAGVAKIDTSTLTVVDSVGAGNHGIVLNSTETFLYVGHTSLDRITKISM